MQKTIASLAVTSALACGATMSFAQAVPSEQPQLLHIIREQVKPGRAAEHAQWETGWPVAYEKSKSTAPYLALASITGAQEVWYVAPFASHDAFGKNAAWEDAQPGLTAEFERLAKTDAEYLSDTSTIQAVAVKELSHGAYPDLSAQRYWEITTFRIRPGHEPEWIAATNAYKAAAARSAPKASWRTYRVVAGAPDGTWLIFSSVTGFGEFDRMMADGDATMKGATKDEMAVLGKFMRESVINVTTNRFRLDPKQSYVDAATKAKDPAFWSPKK